MRKIVCLLFFCAGFACGKLERDELLGVESISRQALTSFETGRLVTLLANANQRYVRPTGSGGDGNLFAQRLGVGTWEVYQIYAGAYSGTYAFKALSSGRFVSAESAGGQALVANRQAIGPWESFYVEPQKDGSFAFKAWINGRYVCAEGAGGAALIANRTAVGDWEKFYVSYVVDVWEAMKRFALNYPNSVKLNTAGGYLLEYKDYFDGQYLWHYQLFSDTTNCPQPSATQSVWDKYTLNYTGDTEIVSILGTKPSCNSGSFWQQTSGSASGGIPRTPRYLKIYENSTTKTPTSFVTWLHLNTHQGQPACDASSDRNANEWGTVFAPTVMSLGYDIGDRWVLPMYYGDTYLLTGAGTAGPEPWYLDLGPTAGVYAPQYGIVGYRDQRFGRIAPDQNVSGLACLF